jgi:hypothetical protein
MVGKPPICTAKYNMKSVGGCSYMSKEIRGTPLVQPIEFVRTLLVELEESILTLPIIKLHIDILQRNSSDAYKRTLEEFLQCA